MKAKNLLYNARIYTQADNLIVNSMAVYKNRIIAIGNNLEHDPDFKSYSTINLKGHTIIPGLVDAHTHFGYFALTFRQVSLDGINSLDKCLMKIKKYAMSLKKNEWVVGDGYSPDRFKKPTEPDRYKLDNATENRPAFIFSKDQHSAWVNSRALELGGITSDTTDPIGGKIERFANGVPTGILREAKGYEKIFKVIPKPSKKDFYRFYQKALDYAYRKGVTGVHSMDSPEFFEFFTDLAEKNKVGLRINYYMSAAKLPDLIKNRVSYGTGTDFFRLAGVKIFADGSLGSQTALCFNKYLGSRDNYGIEVSTVTQLKKIIKQASRLGLPTAIHAIGDKAVSNVLDALKTAPPLKSGARHRIEHLQLIRRKDIPRLKKLGVVASMQPSHCPSDISLVRKYWGRRGANAYIFRTLIDNKIDLAFGSDCPIEPLDPLAGIAAAVRRARPGEKDTFYPDQRITPLEALYNFTAGPAVAVGQRHGHGFLLPGYPADYVVLSDDLAKVAPGRIYDIKVLATILNGQVKYCHSSLSL